jgi:hypothetical protein
VVSVVSYSCHCCGGLLTLLQSSVASVRVPMVVVDDEYPACFE